MARMTPVEVAVKALGSVKAVSQVCHITHSAVSLWRRSGLIPSSHMAALLEQCKTRGVTAEELIQGRDDELTQERAD